MNKALMISIRPEHSVNILNGKKTLELRTWIPKDYKGWVYVYVSKGVKNILYKYKDEYYTQHYLTFTDSVEVLNSKVAFRFWFDEHEEIMLDDNLEICTNEISHEELLKQSCVGYNRLNNYFMNENGDVFGYAWHIKKLEIFYEPKELSGFYITNKGLTYKSIKEYETRTNDSISFRLKKPPQRSVWVYTKENEK